MWLNGDGIAMIKEKTNTLTSRKNNRTRSMMFAFFMAGALLSIISAPVMAQQYLSQQGHLLDANTRLGSFGWNTSARLGALAPRANNFITGNVTGGASFKGSVPYRSVSDFGGTLGSGSLSNFTRDSYGSSNFGSGLNTVRAYQNPSRSVATIHNGRVVNTNRVVNMAATKISQRFADRSATTRQFQTNHSLRSSNSALNNNFSNYALKARPGQTPFAAKPFNATIPSQKYQSENRISLRQQNEIAENKLKTRMDAAIDPATQKETLQPNQLESSGNQKKPYAFQPVQPKSQEELANQNIPFDRKKETQRHDHDPTGELHDTIPGSKEELDAIMALPAIHRQSSDNTQPAPHLKFHQPKITPEAQKQFNGNMTIGNELMAQNRYYHAAAAFDAAAFLDPSNPKAVLAFSQALLCAGEYMSAAWHLSQAIATWPKVVTSQDKIFQDILTSDIFQTTSHELHMLQQATNEPMLSFLKGYVYYKTNENTKANNSLTIILDQQPDNMAVKALLEIVAQATDNQQASNTKIANKNIATNNTK